MVEIFAQQYQCNVSRLEYENFNEFDIQKIKRGSIVYIANPNGNNGHCFMPDEIDYIRKTCELLILDEAYIDYGGQTVVDTTDDKLITIRTLSKSLGVAGLRCGYAVSSKSNITAIQSTRPPIVTTGATAYIIPKLLCHIESTVSRMIKCKDYLNSRYDHVTSHGNYVLLHNKHASAFKNVKFATKDNYLRMALTNKNIIKEHINEY